MFTTKEDTIVAQATPSGKSALSIVRVSGQNLNTLIYSITKKNLLKARYSYLINICCPKTNQIIDKCIVVYYKGPNSYTGEDMLEISCHGSPAITNKIIKTLIGLNVRMAQRGEFSFRAFINKKIDLIQAESINELINSQANIARNGAIDNIHGALSDTIKQIKKSLINLLMIIEHELDFNDNEITETPINEINKIIQKNIKMISDIKRSTDLVDQTKDGIRVVLFGKPNAGKSKLFNCILDQDKAIVSSVAGTTRDFNEQFIEINNIDICLVDTAGYFKTKKKNRQTGYRKNN